MRRCSVLPTLFAFLSTLSTAFVFADVGQAQQRGDYGSYAGNQTNVTPVQGNRTEYADPTVPRQRSNGTFVPAAGAAPDTTLRGNSGLQNPMNFEDPRNATSPRYPEPDYADLPTSRNADTFSSGPGSAGVNPASLPQHAGNSPPNRNTNSNIIDPYRDAGAGAYGTPPPQRQYTSTATVASNSPPPTNDPLLNTGTARGNALDLFQSSNTDGSGTAPLRSNTSTPLNLLLLLASLSANVYLGWIAWDTYNRYQDLVGDIKVSRSRRDRGPRNTDREYSSDDAEAFVN